MSDQERFNCWQYPDIKDGMPTRYQWMVQYLAGFELAPKTDIGAFTYINAKYGVVIEEGVQIGSHCSLYSVSTIDKKQGRIILKRKCKIGSHTTIMPGVTVGTNSVVGAHSFVTHDIPPDALAFGVPARVVRFLSTGLKVDE